MKFVDLTAQFETMQDEIRAAIDAVLSHGRFIMGEEVFALEAELAAYCGARHCISCASGTDALLMALLAHDVKPGDAVIVPAYTFVATAEVVRLLGARPVFVDVEAGSFNIDTAGAAAAVARYKNDRLRGIIAVDLFGQPADYAALQSIAADNDLFLVADAAQSFGAVRDGKKVGGFGDVTATSFFPAKPLGGYGDGGALFTDDDGLAAALRSIRVHGEGEDKYDNVRLGITGRLDTLQAAVLRVKLRHFARELAARRRIAARYSRELSGLPGVQTPRLHPGAESSWAQYTIRSPARDALRQHLQRRGIPTAVYYPKPLHKQAAYWDESALPVAELLAREAVSLPVHGYLSEAEQGEVIAAVRGF